MDMSQILALLPAILAIVVPPLTELVKKLFVPLVGKIPKPALPVIAAIIGALGEALATGGSVSVIGPTAGLAGTGVRDVVHNLRK